MRSLRKVASNVELSAKKRSIVKQPIILRDLSDQEQPSQQGKSYIDEITSRAENRLKNLYQQNTEKIIIETQGTDMECETDRSMLPEEEKPSLPVNNASLADPYYIHYLLVLSIQRR